MAFSTTEEIRASNDKLASEVDISDVVITDRISEADDTIIVDLSSKYSETTLTSLGSTCKVLNLLSRWKSVELTLSRIFGAARQVDQVSDVDYWRKKYDTLIKRILSEEISLSSEDPSVDPVNKPVITSSLYRKKLFPTKGIEDFEEGSVDDQW